ncbi:GNAT family N-acetyltransferase [Pelagerythrobacter marensis]|uniref:Acetyltransferase-like n=1 Tax=Pelagerythrobacter marensis TaxID=543877 RepID=A0A0G3X9D4_9SPHN|nr:N-acetyltransferase [Pelagerythrobacter marensis]AKM07231.1 Acetyltransferase-like [Pelagerythrobacter marensis]
MATIVPLGSIDPALVEELLDRAFGPDRHARTAYRIREGTAWLPALSFAAADDEGYLVGTIQLWPVALTDPEGRAHPMIMVGPVAVVPERQQEGFGKALMLAALGALDAGALPQVMIGDADYYGRFFGFSAAPTAGWHCPGPFDPARLLVRCDNPAILPAEGMLGPWRETASERAED